MKMNGIKKTLGIIGFGQFGQLMAEHLSPFFDIHVYARKESTKESVVENGYVSSSLDEVCASSLLIYAIPVQHLESVLQETVHLIGKDTLVIDIASVKVKPVRLFESYLSKEQPFVATHPMFGPQSAREGLSGLNVALCPLGREEESYKKVKTFLEVELGLNVLEVSPEEHDKSMTYVQVLSHLVARAMDTLDIPDVPYGTKAYSHLREIRQLLAGDSEDLFRTLQQENPYAADMRKNFIKTLEDLDARLSKNN